MGAGFKTGLIVGNQSHRANLLPLRIRDLADDFVVVRIMGLRRELPVNPELIKRLRKFHDPTKGEQIFQTSNGGLRSMIKTAVKNATNRNAAIVTPDSLRCLLKPEGTRFQLQLRELFADDVGDADPTGLLES